jgi:hypothetical protein
MSAVLEGFVKRTELSMLIRGTPSRRESKQGGIEKLLPVLTTASYLPETRLKESAKALMRFGTKTRVGVLASLGFKSELTRPNLLKRF